MWFGRKKRLDFLYCNRSSFIPAAKLTMIQMTILPMLGYGDIIYRLEGKGALEQLDVLYHSAIRCASMLLIGHITASQTHWLMLIYKTLGLTPSYLRYLLQCSSSTYNTHSASPILLKIPKAHTSLGRSSFQCGVVRCMSSGSLHVVLCCLSWRDVCFGPQ